MFSWQGTNIAPNGTVEHHNGTVDDSCRGLADTVRSDLFCTGCVVVAWIAGQVLDDRFANFSEGSSDVVCERYTDSVLKVAIIRRTLISARVDARVVQKIRPSEFYERRITDRGVIPCRGWLQ